jgi:hypothetical protein
MSHGLSLSPAGRLVGYDDPEQALTEGSHLAAEDAKRLSAAFGRSSAAGLIALASQSSAHVQGPDWEFWRGFARRLFMAVCGLGEAAPAQWKLVSPPSDEELAELTAAAPPMRGLEYLTPDVLRHLWGELAAEIAERAAAWDGGPVAFLADVDPLFHQLGRVTFHLAENKRDPQRPFAFLATYSHRLSQRSRVAHLPLAEALKTYAVASERGRLQALLAPVQRAAERSSLVKELLTSKALFAPQAWTIRQAYRFLQQAPQMEEPPAWWFACPIGGRPAARLGLRFRCNSASGSRACWGSTRCSTSASASRSRARSSPTTSGISCWPAPTGSSASRQMGRGRSRERLIRRSAIGGFNRQHANGIDFIEGMRLLAGGIWAR